VYVNCSGNHKDNNNDSVTARVPDAPPRSLFEDMYGKVLCVRECVYVYTCVYVCVCVCIHYI